MTSTITTPDEALADLPLFAELSRGELRKVTSLMTPLDIRAGKTFITEGSTVMEAFILLEGTAVVTRDGQEIAQLGPGAVVGEMALLSGVPRTASVTAKTDIVAEVLNRREFVSLLDQDPSVMMSILVGALRRLHELQG